MPIKSPEHIAFGHAVRELRSRIEISQEELANRSGLHRTYVGGIERGERNPSYTNILRLAEALAVRVSDLVSRAEQLGSS